MLSEIFFKYSLYTFIFSLTLQCPVRPLCEDTATEFGDQVKDLTRKFFQYLLRNRSYEKAFNLAIDIDDEDLFMDLVMKWSFGGL